MPQNLSQKHTKQSFDVRLAKTKEDVARAQRLRFNVFNDIGCGVARAQRLRFNVSNDIGCEQESVLNGLDIEDCDEICDHLIVEDLSNNIIVGNYRLVSPDLYSKMEHLPIETYFNLDNLSKIHGNFIEISRACVHKDYRSGIVSALLWSGIANYVAKHNADYILCAPRIEMLDDGQQIYRMYQQLLEKHLCSAEFKVFPLNPMPEICKTTEQNHPTAKMPPLLKGCLKAGALICGEPDYEPHSNSALIPLLLPIKNASNRYKKRFMN